MALLLSVLRQNYETVHNSEVPYKTQFCEIVYIPQVNYMWQLGLRSTEALLWASDQFQDMKHGSFVSLARTEEVRWQDVVPCYLHPPHGWWEDGYRCVVCV